MWAAGTQLVVGTKALFREQKGTRQDRLDPAAIPVNLGQPLAPGPELPGLWKAELGLLPASGCALLDTALRTL